MISQVIINVDTKLKSEAMRKAKKQGLPFSSVLKLAIKAFVDGRLNVGLVGDEQFNLSTSHEIKEALKDITKNKNISPRFKTADDAVAYLRS
jgi:antitoxin component of RelBE/YafQ-DinJ toxin-antitoxin module